MYVSSVQVSLGFAAVLQLGACERIRLRRPPEKTMELAEEDKRTIQFAVPHNLALGLKLCSVGPGWGLMRLPYAERLVGNPDSGVLHGGAVTSLLDATCGVAVHMKVDRALRIATLDLRIDYLRPATPRLDVLALAECYHLTRNVAFLRAVAYHEGESVDVAAATSTFAVFREGLTRSSITLETEGAP